MHEKCAIRGPLATYDFRRPPSEESVPSGGGGTWRLAELSPRALRGDTEEGPQGPSRKDRGGRSGTVLPKRLRLPADPPQGRQAQTLVWYRARGRAEKGTLRFSPCPRPTVHCPSDERSCGYPLWGVGYVRRRPSGEGPDPEDQYSSPAARDTTFDSRGILRNEPLPRSVSTVDLKGDQGSVGDPSTPNTLTSTVAPWHYERETQDLGAP